jgi:outer membrane protein TolC
VEAGLTTRNDLLRVELSQQQVASQRLTLLNGIEVVRLLLAQLCGTEMHSFDIVTENILSPATPETYYISAEQALDNREETQLLSKSVTASALQVKMERGKNLPTVAVGASAVYYNMMEKNQGNLIGLATVSVPLSSWWGGSHQIRKAKLAHEQSKNNQRDSQEKLQIEILTAWNAVRESYAQIEIARKSVAQANENLRMNRDQYNAGTQDLTELLDAVTLFAQSQNSLTSACADYQSRVADYQRKTR